MKDQLCYVDDQGPGIVRKSYVHPTVIKLLDAPKQIEKLKKTVPRDPEYQQHRTCAAQNAAESLGQRWSQPIARAARRYRIE